MVFKLYYVSEPWSEPYETEPAESDGFLRDVALEDLGEEIEGLVPGRYELRCDGEIAATIIIHSGPTIKITVKEVRR